MGGTAGFVVLAVVLVAAIGIAVAIRRAIKRQQELAALHAPLIDNGDRVNTALRDAEALMLDCDVCGFENVPQNAHCMLCGTKLSGQGDEDENTSRGKGLWRRILLVASPSPDPNCRRHEPFEQKGSGPGSFLNTRQRRARKRKEWARTLQKSSDGQDCLIWHHRSTENSLLQDAFVVNLCRQNLNYSGKNASPSLTTQATTNSLEELNTVIIVPTIPDTERNSSISASHQSQNSPSTKKTNTTIRIQPVHDSQQIPSEVLSTSNKFDAHVFANLSASTFPIKYAHFVTASASLLGEHLEKPRVTFKISRHRAYEQSMTILSELPTESLRSRLSIEFEGESGIDAGGLLRDWLTVMSEGLVGAETCTGSSDAEGNTDANEKGGAGGDGGPRSVRHTNNVFEAASAEDVTYHLRSGLSRADGSESDTMQQPSTVMLAFAAGRFVGRTLLEGYPLGFHLSLPLLKMMVGIPMSFSDLEFFDVESFHSLSWLLEHDGVDALGLDFTVTEMYEMASSSEETKQVVKTRELVAGGADIDVTDANKREFVSLKFRDLVFGRVERELGSFLRGVYEVVPADLLALFDPEEMDYLVSGSDEIDVGDWRRNTKYNEDLQGHMAMRWFWELVEEMPTEYRRRLLRFSTGSSRVPLGGFAALTSHDGKLCPFTLIGVSYVYSNGYIRSHACFNRLDLPLYVDRDDLKRVLYTLLGAESTAGFTME